MPEKNVMINTQVLLIYCQHNRFIYNRLRIYDYHIQPICLPPLVVISGESHMEHIFGQIRITYSLLQCFSLTNWQTKTAKNQKKKLFFLLLSRKRVHSQYVKIVDQIVLKTHNKAPPE